jgi:hypothetical protein
MGLVAGFGIEGTALLDSEERGAGDAALADRVGFFCVTLVQSLLVRGPFPSKSDKAFELNDCRYRLGVEDDVRQRRRLS